jgi:hypothetical protein
MPNRIKAALGRLGRSEHGFHDQRAASRYRDRQDIDTARGQSYDYPPGP